ncbi:hypothetical protein FB45DRAFT_859982 [Roridomyces roridus]|uniref:Uncharacterized protein n=1 Tax=Roridomyces roridus TaxID=1738132 RepID=A0AAD7CDJ4_9AGAR|nr:hypothetical protein FB45DRAFT_859982 [Roridomyces roridus]
MHCCLLIQEILRHICAELNTFQKADRFKRGASIPPQVALAAMARTCKYFSDTALAELWASATLLKLLRCLPDEVVSKRSKFPTSMLTAADGERPRFYASRIKHLMLCGAVDTTILWTWRKSRSHSARVSLGIALGKAFKNSTATVSTFLRDLKSPETVSITTAVMCQALHHLASRPNLRSLRLGTSFNGIFPRNVPLPPPTTNIQVFLSLRHLRLQVSTQGASQFLEWCTQVPLEHIGIRIVSEKSSTGTQLHQLFRMLLQAASNASLSSLVVTSRGCVMPAQNRTEYLFLGESIRLLSNFPNLRMVYLSVVGVDIDDTTVFEFTKGCPRLESSSMISDSAPVSHFLSLFPNIRNLRTMVDFKRADERRAAERAAEGELAMLDPNTNDSEQDEYVKRESEAMYHFSLWKEVVSLIPGCAFNAGCKHGESKAEPVLRSE